MWKGVGFNHGLERIRRVANVGQWEWGEHVPQLRQRHAHISCARKQASLTGDRMNCAADRTTHQAITRPELSRNTQRSDIKQVLVKLLIGVHLRRSAHLPGGGIVKCDALQGSLDETSNVGNASTRLPSGAVAAPMA